MARLIITRPNGETEYAELTTDKSLVDGDSLFVFKYGMSHYAKLGPEPSTHMFVIMPSVEKLYVQKTLATLVKFDYTEYGNGDLSQLSFNMNNPNPKEVSGVKLLSIRKAEPGRDTNITLYIRYFWTGEIILRLKDMKAVFLFKNSRTETADVGKQGIDIIRTYAKNTPFEVSINPE